MTQVAGAAQASAVTTLLDALLTALQGVGAYNPQDEAPLVAVLWKDQ
jgi:hypothetical protein